MFVGFILILIFAGSSMEFQDKCEARCGDSRAMTPLVDLHETCFCDEGNGRWRREPDVR